MSARKERLKRIWGVSRQLRTQLQSIRHGVHARLSGRQSVVEQVQNHTQSVHGVLHTRSVKHLLGWPLGVLLVTVNIVSRVAVAQGLIDTAVCGTELSALVTSLFTALILALALYGVGHTGNGLRKMSSGGSTKVKEGRTEMLYSGLGYAGAILVGNAPTLLEQLGLTIPDCISFAGL